MSKQKTIVDEAQEIYESSVKYYEYVRANDRTSDTMLRQAEQSMYDSYGHLQDMRYWAGKGMLD